MVAPKKFAAWHHCDICEFEGKMSFAHIAEESYEGTEDELVLLDATCPSCGSDERVMLALDHYHEILPKESTET